MTEEDRSKRRPGAKPAGQKPRGPSAGKGAGKPAAGKSFAKRSGADSRSGGPKRKFDAANSGDDTKKFEGRDRPKRDFGGDERPARDFRRSDRPQSANAGAERPFRKGARPDGKQPFRKREDGDRPFAAREGDQRRGERPQRDFRPDRTPREDGDQNTGDRFSRTPHPDGRPFAKRDGGGKPSFVKRKDDERPFAARDGDQRRDGRGERPQRGFGSERRPREDGEQSSGVNRFARGPRPEGKPFVKRDGDGKQFAPRDGNKPFMKRDGGDKPFTPRGERSSAFGKNDRPKRDFADDRKPGSGQFKPRARPAAEEQESGERIAKRLARAGIASRRDAEELIAAGRVRVNGVVLTSPAFNVQPSDVIHLDGVTIPPIERTRLFLFHKPAGVVTTNRDPEGRKTVFDVLPVELPRLMTVGRLDINTEGLLLLTNDGGLARALELPATGWLRRYRVRVHGKVDEQALADLKNGIAVDGVFYGGAEASLERVQGSNAWINIGLREGKNREVRNILGALGLEVNRLIRISYGPFQLNELPEGHVLEVKGRMLRDQLGERLVEESGANFDAEIVKPFSNRPVRREERRETDFDEGRPASKKPPRLDIGEGGLIKRRKMREGSRDEALGKLSTRPGPGGGHGFGGKPQRKPEGSREGGRNKERPPLEPPGQRKANVWMAPGARPQRERDQDSRADKRSDGGRPDRGPRKPQGGGRSGPGKGPKRS